VAAKGYIALGYPSERIQVIHNGFDLKRLRPDMVERAQVRDELGIAGDAFVICYVARFDPQKDHPGFLNAARLFAEEHAKAVFVLCGPQMVPENETLRAWIAEHSLNNRVKLLGSRPDVDRLLRGMDIATSSSAFAEGFPNVVGEAMATALPVVATAVGEVETIVGDAGIVVPPRSPETLAAAWAEIAALAPKTREELGLRARQRIKEHFSIEAVANEYSALYASLASAAPRPA
jgi:glycosyltransferase involved in cell wall biosynthesis